MRGWSNYFFMVGSAAAALIGLMFIVATLAAGRDRKQLEAGKKLYTTPIVWHLGVVVVLSGAALAPELPGGWLGTGTVAVGLVGAAYCIFITVGILRAQLASHFSSYDAFWYGVAPALIYLLVALSGWGLARGAAPAAAVLAAGVMALLLVSIHNEWDLVTFLAPAASPDSSSHGGES